MNIENRLALSYYKNIAPINETHHVFLAQHQENQRMYVKKVLDVYNRHVYEHLKNNPIHGVPIVFECFEDDHTLTIIEEYISGDDLETLISKNGPMPPNIAVTYLCELCKIVSQLHQCTPPIIHRDIKPSNIMVTPSRQLYLLDLNAAKHYKEAGDSDTVLLGTQGYAAPEQYGFGVSTIQTDIYSMGVLLKTMLAGQFVPPTNANFNHFIPPALNAIIDRCTQMDAKDRYPSVHELQKDLESFLKGKEPLDNSKTYKLRWAPPGFRSLLPSHMIVAGLVYWFVIFICLNIEEENASIPVLWYDRICLLLSCLFTIFMMNDYFNIQRFIPLCKSKNKVVHYIGTCLLGLISMTVLLFVLIGIQVFIF